MNALLKSCLLIVFMLSAARAFAAVPITVVNYSKLPVYATAIAIDEAELCAKLGLPAGSPFHVRQATGQGELPLTRAVEDGRAVLRLYLSLAPLSRLDLIAEPGAPWPESQVVQASCDPASASGAIANGILGMRFDPKGWRLAFTPLHDGRPAATLADQNVLVENGQLDFWVDTENRGRLLNNNPRDLGLIHYATDAHFEKCDAATGPDGRPVFRIVRRLAGFAKAMTVTETYELLPGQPVLICRIQWRNDGAAPLWIAYVGSGDGVKGRWSKKLLPTPLIERKKTATEGDLNGAETRPSWLPQFCRISMESPATGCGFGMSTLLPTPRQVGTGSMVWGCGASGFQCNLIDPAKGQFPFLVPAHGKLDNGFAFVATQAGTSVFRQTVELWTAVSSGKSPRLAPPCAVFIGGEAREAAPFTEWGDPAQALMLLTPQGEARQAALRLDFNKFYQLRATVREAYAQNAVEIVARPLSENIKQKPVTLLRADKPGEYTLDLNKQLNWKDEVPLVLEVKTSGNAALQGLALAETLPIAPEPLSPLPDASVTDLATMFRWKAIPMVVDYELQWARTADFTAPIEKRFSKSDPYAYYLPLDNELPAPGDWFWRVRGSKGSVVGEWSAPRRFTVNAEHPLQPLKRPLTPERPLFTLEATRVLDYTQFHPDIPADIAPYVGIIAEGFESKGLTVEEFARGMDKLPHSIMLRSHWVGLADIEWLCQHVPNFIGIQGGEHLTDLYKDGKDGAMTYAHRLTRLCAKYGCLYQEADGTYKEDKWQDLMDHQGAFVREFGRYLVLSQKNNIIRRQLYSQSAAMGLWLGGLTHQHGAWEDGGFYWQNAGFGELGTCTGERTGVLKTMPRIFWSLVCVMGVARGCGLYSLDGQTLMVSSKEIERGTAWSSGIWDNSGKTTECFKRFVAPLIRGVVSHRLIPTKEELLRNIKLAVYNDKKVAGDLKAWPHYLEYGPLYAATYGFRKMGNIDGQLWEFFPNTGRYSFIPVLVQGNEPLGGGVKNLPVSQLQNVADVKRIFDATYPAWYEGDALVMRAGDTVTVQNSRENEDVPESFSVPLCAQGIKNIAGKIQPHSYMMMKLEDQGQKLWLQANTEYPERDSVLSIACDRKPEWTILPAAASKAAIWDEANKTLNLRLGHQQGAVEVGLK